MQLCLTNRVAGRGCKRKATVIFTVFESSAKTSDGSHKRMEFVELDVLRRIGLEKFAEAEPVVPHVVRRP
jgi:hypothetical protein